MGKKETIQYVKDRLADPAFYEYGLLAYMLRDIVPETEAPLRTLTLLLGSPWEYCAKDDVQFVIDSLERKGHV